jgi:hypothetical protein
VYRAIVLPPQGIQAEAPAVDPVAAYFGSPTAVAPTTTQPAIQRQPTPIATPEIAPTVNQPAASTTIAPPLLQRQPAAVPHTPAPAKPAITPTPATAATPTTAQPAAPVTVEEKEDLRLSAIMRLHEEKASREAETAAPAPTTPPVQRQPATRPTPTPKAPETRQQPPVLAPPPRRPRPSLPGETAVSEQPIQRQPETTTNITPAPELTSTPAMQPEITPTESVATTAVEPTTSSSDLQRQAVEEDEEGGYAAKD